jgi:hypothetical protein
MPTRNVESPNPTSEDNPVVREDIRCNCCEQDIAREGEYTDWEVEGEYYDNLCRGCVDETCTCESCGETMWTDGDYRRWTEHGDVYCEECYNERYTYCADCDEEVDIDDSFYHEGRGETLCEGCYTGEEDVDLDSYHHRDNITSKTFEAIKSKRMVGLEVECYSDGWSYWDEAEIDGNWRAVHDGSINAYGDNSRGVEFVSRHPANGDKLFNDIMYLCHFVEQGFSVNRSCGMHVHVDGRDLDYEGLKYALLIGKSVQNIIYKMMPPSRDGSRWCRRIPMSRLGILNIDSNEEFIESWYDSWGTSPSMEKYNDSRYCGMNMHARIIHGSIEFRYHSATINPIKIVNWVKICTAIVDKAKEIAMKPEDNALLEIIKTRDLNYLEFFDLLDLDDSVEKYVNKRMVKFYNYEKKEDYAAIEYYI